MALITNLSFAGPIYAPPLVLPPANYSSVGTVISDGGGFYNNDSNYAPDKTFDGNTNTFYNTSAGGSTTNFVGRDLLTAYPVNRVTLLPRQDAVYAMRMNNALVQYSTNGSTWTTVYTVSTVTMMNYTTTVVADFTTVTARYWRLYGAVEGNVSEMQIRLV